MTDQQINAKYPNEAVPDEVKNSIEYGKSVGAYIERQWFGGDHQYSTKRSRIRELRTHMKGRINTDDMYDIMGIDKDSSNIAIDWTPPRILSRYINDTVDSSADRIGDIKVRGIDPISNTSRKVYTETMRMAMVTAQFSQQYSQATKVNVMPDGPTPESEDELQLHMNLDYHTLSEMAGEATIKAWLELNGADELDKQVLEDLAIAGEGGFRVKRNGDKIKLERCVPEHTIYSDDSEYARDGRGTHYYGVVRKMSIGDLKHFTSSRGEHLTDEKIQQIASASKNFLPLYGYTNEQDKEGSRYDDDRLVAFVIDFSFKTTNQLVYKKKYNKYGGHKLIKKESSFEKVDDSESYDVLRSEYDCWYEGLYIPGVGDVYGYGKVDNQPRKLSNLKQAVPPVVYYKLSTESVASRILPYAKQIYITHIKIQQLIAKMRPDGYAIDISALSDIDLLDGKQYTVDDILIKLSQEGNLIYDGEKLDGRYNPGKPVVDLPAPQSGRLVELTTMYLHWIRMIQSDTGITEAMSAVVQDSKALVGTQKMQLAGSLKSIQHIITGIMNIRKRTADTILMQSQMMSRNKVFSKQLVNAVGSYNADVLTELVKMGNYEYQIRIEVAPTREEEDAFNVELQLALKAGTIAVDDIIDIRRIKNISMARAMLKFKSEKRARAMAQMNQAQAQMEQQKLAMTNQFKLQELQAKAQGQMLVDKNKILLEVQAEMEKERNSLLLRKQFGNPEFQEKTALKEMDHQNHLDGINEQQDRMDKRSNRTKTQESEISDQKLKELPPKDFENNIENLTNLGESSKI